MASALRPGKSPVCRAAGTMMGVKEVKLETLCTDVTTVVVALSLLGLKRICGTNLLQVVTLSTLFQVQVHKQKGGIGIYCVYI